MSNLAQTLSTSERLFQTKNVIRWAIILSCVSLLFFMFFSGPMKGVERPIWYRVITFILLEIAMLGAAMVCLRNGLSKQMPSGTQVWLLTGLALCSYSIGNLFFCLWELLWGLDPVGSLGDPFFVIFYILISIGMIIAVIDKKIKLKIYQWSIIAGITTYAAVMTMWIVTPPPTSANSTAPVVATAQSSSTQASPTAEPAAKPAPNAPEWVKSMDTVFKPYGAVLSQFYVWNDVVLFGFAVAMILAFWGGRLSNAWQFNAQAIICFYVADMWLAYATNHLSGYQSGFMLEVFWAFGAIQFGVAAALEFEHMTVTEEDRYY